MTPILAQTFSSPGNIQQWLRSMLPFSELIQTVDQVMLVFDLVGLFLVIVGAVMLAVGIESMGIPFPGETTLIAAAAYAGSTHKPNIGLVIAAAAAGAIIGDNIGFGIGH